MGQTTGDFSGNSGAETQKELLLSRFGTKQLKVVRSVLKEKMLDRGSIFGKENPKLLADKINFGNNEVRLYGSYAALVGALCMSTKAGYPETLPTFVLNWLPKQDGSGQWEELILL